MKKNKLPKLVIFGDPQKGDIAKAIGEFRAFIAGKAQVVATYNVHECKCSTAEKSDFAIVFGGDGSIICAARALNDNEVPIIGVNLGKLGFLAEFNIEELKEYFSDIISGKLNIESRMMLSCGVFNKGREKFRSIAINDIFITAGPPFRMIELKMSVDGQPLAGCVSDGIIVATPTGSTAYNLSCGGPVISGSMEAMVITPICPHSLSFRPIVINADRKVEIIGVELNDGSTLSIDGQIRFGLTKDDVVRIEKGGGSFLVVNNPARTYWDTLATKLGWAEKPKYKMNESRLDK